MSSCTAWASELRGPAGAATTGAVLIAGFLIGPFVGAVFARAGQRGVQLSFAVAAAVVVAAMVIAVAARQRARDTGPETTRSPRPSLPTRQGTAWALSWAMPLAPWESASATIGFTTIPGRIHTGLSAPMAAGTATLIVNGVSGVIQVLTRAHRWGPQADTAGTVLAALGYATTAVAPPTMSLTPGLPLLLVLGCASGLCLTEGLIDLEVAAPQRLRGALVGAFYVGFGLPLMLTTLGYAFSAAILAVMATLALGMAVSRAVRLRRTGHRRPN